jgi:hypothetical protein
MRREHERTAVRPHDGVQMLHALEANAAQRLFERSGQQPWQLDDGHSEVLRSAAGESPALTRRQLRVGAGEVGEGDAAAPWQRRIRKVTEAPAEPEGHRERDTAGGGGQAARD